MRRRHTIVAALAAVIVLFLVGCARTPEQRANRIVEHIADDLKLNESQKVELYKIKDEFLARRLDMIAARNEGYDEAIQLMKSDTIDRGKLDELVKKSQSRTDDTIQFFFTKLAEFHDMLTPEQRTKVAEHMEKFRERYHR